MAPARRPFSVLLRVFQPTTDVVDLASRITTTHEELERDPVTWEMPCPHTNLLSFERSTRADFDDRNDQTTADTIRIRR
ncbi:hypothetical protein PG995_002521 [Apiospora arundinis]